MLVPDEDLSFTVGAANDETALANGGKYGIAVRRLEEATALAGIAEDPYGLTVTVGPGGLPAREQEGKEKRDLDKSLHNGKP